MGKRIMASLLGMTATLIFAALLATATAQAATTTSNVVAAQVPGTKQVVITYDVSSDVTNLVTVSLVVSNAAGVVSATHFSGDVGPGVAVGTGRQIVWDGGADQDGQNLSGLKVWVDASAGAGGTVPAGMVAIPAGTNSGTDPDFGAYSLTVETFYMDATEVTKAKWDEVYVWAVAHGYGFDNDLHGEGPHGQGKAANHPVHTVDWYDCVKWCNARSEKEERTPCYTVGMAVYKTGQSAPDYNDAANGYRLPTMTEWEYAARGGLNGKCFPWGDTITHSQANYYSSSSYGYDTSPTRGYHPTYDEGGFPYTSPGGSFAANGYGLYDMAGNVLEWCNDSSGSNRYFRGGSWTSDACIARCGLAFWWYPDFAFNHYGFRAVCR